MISARPPPWPAPGRAISALSPAARCRRPGGQHSGRRLGPERRLGHVACRRRASKRSAGGGCVALFGLPPDAGIGFVTGATMANFSALAAARHALLGRLGWDVEARGLFGAPPITVVVGAEVHVSVLKALEPAGARPGARGPRRGRRPGADAAGGHPRPDRAGDHLRSGRQREHRGLRPGRGDLRASPRHRIRGCTSTAPSACGRRPARTGLIWQRGSRPRTRGRPMPTSG